VQVDCLTRSCVAGSMLTLNELPPTTWWTCGDCAIPGLTKGSILATTSCEQLKRIICCAAAPWASSPRDRAVHFILACWLVKNTEEATQMSVRG
jgi:hypothetical protein